MSVKIIELSGIYLTTCQFELEILPVNWLKHEIIEFALILGAMPYIHLYVYVVCI